MAELAVGQAYAAMFAFLEQRHRLSESDELGTLLGRPRTDSAVWRPFG